MPGSTHCDVELKDLILIMMMVVSYPQAGEEEYAGLGLGRLRYDPWLLRGQEEEAAGELSRAGSGRQQVSRARG